MTDETTPIVPEPALFEGACVMTPVKDPYEVYVNVEGPLAPPYTDGAHDGDYYWTEDGYLVLGFALMPNDVVQIKLGTRRQIYRYPEGAPADVRLLQVPVIEYKSREDEPEPSRIIT